MLEIECLQPYTYALRIKENRALWFLQDWPDSLTTNTTLLSN